MRRRRFRKFRRILRRVRGKFRGKMTRFGRRKWLSRSGGGSM